MSGHSKWSKIKRKKGANDAKRGALFTKLSKAITMAAAEGGGDADMNFTLRLAIDKAREANMPTNNIERAVQKGTGEGGEKVIIQRINYEGTGPAGSFFIVMCTTDNTNRTVSELRKIFENGGGSLGTSGSAMWNFDEIGVIEIKAEKLKESEKFGQEASYEPTDKEELQLELFDIPGIENIIAGNPDDGYDFEIRTSRNDFGSVHKAMESRKLHIMAAELRFVPKDPISPEEIDEEKILNLMETLDDQDDVDSVFSNLG